MSEPSVDKDVEMVCDLCSEPVPLGQTVLRDGGIRLCWMCYADELTDREDGDDDADEEDWDDDDDDEDWEDWDD